MSLLRPLRHLDRTIDRRRHALVPYGKLARRFLSSAATIRSEALHAAITKLAEVELAVKDPSASQSHQSPSTLLETFNVHPNPTLSRIFVAGHHDSANGILFSHLLGTSTNKTLLYEVEAESRFADELKDLGKTRRVSYGPRRMVLNEQDETMIKWPSEWLRTGGGVEIVMMKDPVTVDGNVVEATKLESSIIVLAVDGTKGLGDWEKSFARRYIHSPGFLAAVCGGELGAVSSINASLVKLGEIQNAKQNFTTISLVDQTVFQISPASSGSDHSTTKEGDDLLNNLIRLSSPSNVRALQMHSVASQAKATVEYLRRGPLLRSIIADQKSVSELGTISEALIQRQMILQERMKSEHLRSFDDLTLQSRQRLTSWFAKTTLWRLGWLYTRERVEEDLIEAVEGNPSSYLEAENMVTQFIEDLRKSCDENRNYAREHLTPIMETVFEHDYAGIDRCDRRSLAHSDSDLAMRGIRDQTPLPISACIARVCNAVEGHQGIASMVEENAGRVLGGGAKLQISLFSIVALLTHWDFPLLFYVPPCFIGSLFGFYWMRWNLRNTYRDSENRLLEAHARLKQELSTFCENEVERLSVTPIEKVRKALGRSLSEWERWISKQNDQLDEVEDLLRRGK